MQQKVQQWYMLSVLGKDQAGIVSRVSTELFNAGCHLGEASMNRLGGNFTIMMMVRADNPEDLIQRLNPITLDMDLRLHIDPIAASLHDHRQANVRISVYGADRAGIVSHVTSVLARAGLDILDLQSDVAGSEDKPVYVMNIEGYAAQGVEALQQALAQISSDVQVNLQPIDTLFA
ncbi:MAG: amino acid-binding protein [Gammaproteobacteria bacterium]|nr:amino acid-binding protein [Gammaproteobacteria bacterium]MDH5800741.1 amino acid-binding protein [Gammaproteobacteria bacterium]